MWYNVFEVRELRILSIDFDYFVNPTALQRALYFPDGGREMSDTLNTFVWAGAYAHSKIATKKAGNEKNSLMQVELLKKPLQTIHNIVMAQGDIRYMVADSHAHSYDFINENWDGSVTELYNVDFHHDTFDVGEGVHCGNWLRWLLNDGTVDVAYWVNQPDSELADNMTQMIPLSELPKTGYDLVYICRSGWWTPPHMDEAFIKYLARPLIENKNGWEVKYQQGIKESRYNNELKTLVKQECVFRDKFPTDVVLQEDFMMPKIDSSGGRWYNNPSI